MRDASLVPGGTGIAWGGTLTVAVRGEPGDVTAVLLGLVGPPVVTWQAVASGPPTGLAASNPSIGLVR